MQKPRGVSGGQSSPGLHHHAQDIFERARTLGCTEAWVLTDTDNVAARRMYRAAGGVEEPSRPVMFTFPLNAPETAG